MAFRITGNIIFESGRDDRACGHTVSMFQCPAEFGDTRRTAVSAAYSHNGGIPLFLDLGPQGGIVREDHALGAAGFDLH